MSNDALRAGYQRPLVGLGYDLLARAVFAPVHGLDTLRDQAVDHFGITAGERVLELGCGTGGITARLVGRGAVVTAIDWSAPMLARARRRAPAARFQRAEITTLQTADRFDVALFAFVLHELNEADRALALAVAARALSPRGRLAVVDHALPKTGVVPRAMSAFVHGFEPQSSRGWMRGGMDGELRAAGFDPGAHHILARGLAVALTASLGA